MTRVIAKATSKAEHSGAIVVSFDSRWLRPIQDARVRAVLRKRVPTSADAKWMYLYVNSPVAAIVARARITRIEKVTSDDASEHVAELVLTVGDIDKYIGDADTVGMYVLNDIAIAEKPLTISEMGKELVFYPPQSFLFLSDAGKGVIDRRTGFQGSGKQKAK